MKTFNKQQYQRQYYQKNKRRIRRKSQEYYYFNRYGKTYEEIMKEKEEEKPYFHIEYCNFVITFE
jgi:hypothetical protein